MALANQFGDQAAYKCTNCGQTVALYSPSCPRCLDNTLVQVEKKTPEKYRPVTQVSGESTKQGHPLVPVAALAIIMALAVALYNRFGPPRTESMTKTEPIPTLESTSTAPQVSSTVRVSKNPPVKHSKPSNSRPVSKTQRVSAPGSISAAPAAKPATPMKLWQESSDDSGDK